MLVRPSNLGLLALAVVGALLAMMALPTPRPESASAKPQPSEVPAPTEELETVRATLASSVDEPAPAAEKRDAEPTGWGIARMKSGRTVSLRDKPGGKTIANAGSRTEFGSKRVFAVVETRGRWLGVTAVERPNGKLAWIDSKAGGIKLGRVQVSLRADLSKRNLKLRIGRKTVASMTVAIGRPGADTPTGRFQVTDKLSGGNYGPYYGCCILALSGKQPNLPAGWKGGNRLAIHGTNAPGAIGKAASAGCLRGSDRDLKLLMRRVPVGTPVFISP